MAFDPSKVIDSFVSLDSLPTEAKQSLGRLKESLMFVAPEMLVERLFYDFKSQKGLSSILSQYAPSNPAAAELFRKTVASLPRCYLR